MDRHRFFRADLSPNVKLSDSEPNVKLSDSEAGNSVLPHAGDDNAGKLHPHKTPHGAVFQLRARTTSPLCNTDL
jgi:hypothetical protein